MPIYEYVCDDCGENYERIVLNDRTKVVCPQCDSAKQTIKLSVFAASGNGGKSSGETSASGGCGCTPRGCGCH
jgi:putative FmdB family regulatory protein